MKSNSEQASESELSTESPFRRARFAGWISNWSGRRPVLAIVFVSWLAVMVNCYPVIFCGRSFVSPTEAGIGMVYSWWPPLPGMVSTPPMNAHGSDTAAMLIWAVPVGFVESRSLWEHGTLPLWNRYSHCGDTLIGQAVSMLGDPLQMIVILGRGSALAWDIKFLTAKFLFCVGFGLLIFRLLGSHPLSLIYAALAAYCGAFFYIRDHPVFFVFCYSPWILLSAMAMLDLSSRRFIRWGLVWLLANVSCFNAGHVEVAVVLIGGLNLAAIIFAWANCRDIAGRAKVLTRMAVGALLFFGLTAPVWMSFLGAVANSYSAHSQILVGQLRFVTLPGIFDDIFYLLLLKDESSAAYAPGASLLIMVGCIFAELRWRQLKNEPFFWINNGAILLWGGCIFGWIPPRVLGMIPFLNRVGHIYTDFSYLLIIHLIIQSAYGFRCLAQGKNLRRTAIDFLWVAFIFAGLVLLYSFGIRHYPIPWNYVLCAAAGAFGAPLLFAFLKNQGQPISVAGWLGILILGFIPHFRFGFYSFGNNDLLMLMGPRAVLNAPSEAIDKIKADTSGPFRVVGIPWIFYGDYAATYGIEDIRSCAPLSNQEYINLAIKFPGMNMDGTWIIEALDPVRAQPLLNLLNVKYLLTPLAMDAPQSPGYRLWEHADMGVVENLEVWPRAFFSDKIVSISSNDEFIKYLDENGKKPFVALTPDEIEKQPGVRPLENTNEAIISPAKNYQLLPNSTAFDVHAPAAGIVCLTEEQAKDFTATANGQPEKILTVNRAFKGIYLDKPGDYHIKFIYRPHHWPLACILFSIATAGVIALAFVSLGGSTKKRDNGLATEQNGAPHE